MKKEKCKKVELLEYDSGAWYINDELDLIVETDPHITLNDDPLLWLSVDDDGYIGKLMTLDGELSEDSDVFIEKYKHLIGNSDNVWDHYSERIYATEMEMLEEFAKAYREELSKKGVKGEVHIITNKAWMSANRYDYVKLLAEPLKDQYIVLIK